MMLPILISVSVTPVSYFFCAAAGPEAAATSPKNPSKRPSVLTKSQARYFMSFLLGYGVTVLSDSSLEFFRIGRTIAGVPVCRKRRTVKGRFVAQPDCAARRGNFRRRSAAVGPRAWLTDCYTRQVAA